MANEFFDKSNNDAGNFTVNVMGIEHTAAMIGLQDAVVFPFSLASVTLDKKRDIAAFQEALAGNR